MKKKLIILGIIIFVSGLALGGVAKTDKLFGSGFSNPFNNIQAQPLTDDGTTTYFTDQTSDFAIGGTGSGAALWFDESAESLIVGSNLGVNTTTPQMEVQAVGLMGIYPDGTGTTTCSSLIEGALMYATGTAGFYWCDGSAWNAF